jgi:hypothetical protein
MFLPTSLFIRTRSFAILLQGSVEIYGQIQGGLVSIVVYQQCASVLFVLCDCRCGLLHATVISSGYAWA